MCNCLSRSISEIHWPVAGTLSNQQTTTHQLLSPSIVSYSVCCAHTQVKVHFMNRNSNQFMLNTAPRLMEIFLINVPRVHNLCICRSTNPINSIRCAFTTTCPQPLSPPTHTHACTYPQSETTAGLFLVSHRSVIQSCP